MFVSTTHPALLAIGQQLVFFLGVEDERVRCEVDGLPLEGGTFICADKQHLISFIYRGTHQNYLKEMIERTAKKKRKKKKKKEGHR